MPGFLHRFFAPRWRHPNAHVRRAAVGRLDPDQDRSTLLTLLDDEDPGVRHAALERLDDPREWLRRGPYDRPELNEHLIAHLVGERATSLPLEERQALVADITSPAMLSEIAFRADNQQLRLSALARLHDEAVLIDHARRNSIAAVRQAAAARVESDAGLEQLARDARRDRTIARQARSRLALRRAEAREIETRDARREELLTALERHGAHRWEPLYDARYRHLLREWQTLADSATREQEYRFRQAEQRCRITIHEHEAQQRALEAERHAQAQAQASREDIIAALEGTLAHLSHSQQPGAQEIDSLTAQRRLQAERWRALSDERSPEADVQARYERLLAELDEVGAAWQRLQTHAGEIERALEAGEHQTLARLEREIAWPDTQPRPALLDELVRARRAQDADRATEEAASVEQEQIFAADLKRLDALLEKGELRTATRRLDALKQRAPRLAPGARERFDATLKRLTAKTAELKDWRGYVAAPKREQLCAAMEALAEEPLHDMEREHRHRQLVNEWRALGDAAATRALSSRFRAASDRVKASLADYYAQRAQLRAENLALRTALCEQLEALLASPDAEADPDALRTIRNRAREEWQRSTPIPREQAETLRRRFAHAMHGLQALIDQRARTLADAKRALVEQARALAEDSGDVETRAERAKQLQQQWRALGRAPKGEEQALWKTFRQFCDALFAAREEQRGKRKAQQNDRFEAMQALIDRLDAWHPQHVDDRQVLDEAEAEAIRLAPLPAGRRAEGMQRRWNGILRARYQALDQLASDVLIVRWQEWQPLLQAHVEADTRALAGETVDDVTTDIVLDSDARQAHRQRNQARRTPLEEGDDRLRHLRVYLAVLADVPLDREDESRRLDVQVARLNDSVGTTMTRRQELAQLQLRLLATGPVSAAVWHEEAPRLNDLMTAMRERVIE